MNEIRGAPQTRQAWLDLTAGNREVRGRPEGSGGVELYGSKRSFLGRVLAFIKDPLFAGARAAKREAAGNELQQFIGRSGGLSREQVRDVFERAGVHVGQPLKRDALERVFAEIDRLGSPGSSGTTPPTSTGGTPPKLEVVPRRQPNPPPPLETPAVTIGTEEVAPKPPNPPTLESVSHVQARMPEALTQPTVQIEVPTAPTVPSHTQRSGDVPLSRGRLDISDVGREAQREMRDNHGVMGPKLMMDVIRSGLLDLGIDPRDRTLEVSPLGGQGAQSMGLLKVEVGGKMLFAVKDSGTLMAMPEGTMFGGYTKGRDGVWSEPLSFEDRRLQKVEENAFGSMGTLEGRNGVRVGFAQTEATFRYVPPGKETAVQPNGEYFGGQMVEHQVSVLRAAPGEKADHIFDRGKIDEMKAAASTLGSALGALHAKYTDGERVPTGGLRTLIHGDFHPANIFIDGKTVTLIDLAGAASNFDREPNGFDMLRDVQRTLAQGALSSAAKDHPELRQIFLAAYAENFAHIKGPDGQPEYTVEKMDALLKATTLDNRGKPQLVISSEPIT